MKNNDFIFEAYPESLLDKIEQREKERMLNVPDYINGDISNLVIADLKLWRVGTLQVSFKGGSKELHEEIANTASEWAKYGNIELDFGKNPKTGTFRSWHINDESHIRVGFEFRGYWSLVGTDSKDTAIVKPGEITLNLSGFDNGLPVDWKQTVLHEFGHALGFLHEHQTPLVKCGFNWPLVYDRLGGPPNFWNRERVNRNFRQIQKQNITHSHHDINSIMHYALPEWMFVSGRRSPCFTNGSDALSETDKKMMALSYPFDQDSVLKIDSQRKDNLKELIELSKDSPSMMASYQEHLDYYQALQ